MNDNVKAFCQANAIDPATVEAFLAALGKVLSPLAPIVVNLIVSFITHHFQAKE